MNDEVLIMIASHCKLLEYLILNFCCLITDRGISEAAKYLVNLKTIRMQRTNIGKAGIDAIVRYARNLEDVDISYCTNMSNASILDNIPKLKYLKVLNLGSSNETDEITDETLIGADVPF